MRVKGEGLGLGLGLGLGWLGFGGSFGLAAWVGGHLELVAQGVEELADLEEAQQLEEPHEAQSLEQLDEL